MNRAWNRRLRTECWKWHQLCDGEVIRELCQLTWNDVLRVHGIIILNEAKPIHELNFGDVPSPVGLEMLLDLLLRDWAAQSQLSAESRER